MRLLIPILILSLAGCTYAPEAEVTARAKAHTEAQGSTPEPDPHPVKKDVRIGKRSYSDYTTKVVVKVTNHTEEKADYSIHLLAETRKGRDIETAHVYLFSVKPGKTVREKAAFYKKIPDRAVFRIIGLERTSPAEEAD